MTTVVSVRFRSGCKTYYFDPKDLTVEAGQDVIVETAQGPEFAQCCEGNHAVPDEQVVPPLRAVLRLKRRRALSRDSPSLTRISDIFFPPLT